MQSREESACNCLGRAHKLCTLQKFSRFAKDIWEYTQCMSAIWKLPAGYRHRVLQKFGRFAKDLREHTRCMSAISKLHAGCRHCMLQKWVAKDVRNTLDAFQLFQNCMQAREWLCTQRMVLILWEFFILSVMALRWKATALLLTCPDISYSATVAHSSET